MSVRYTIARTEAATVTDLVFQKLGRRPTACRTEETRLFGGDFENFDDLVRDVRRDAGASLPQAAVEALAHNHGSNYPAVLSVARGAGGPMLLVPGQNPGDEILTGAVRSRAYPRMPSFVVPISAVGHPGLRHRGAANVMARELQWTQLGGRRSWTSPRRPFRHSLRDDRAAGSAEARAVMRVLITGGTGFIGSRLALRCLGEGHAVRVLGRRNNAAEAANAEALVRAGAQIHDVSVSEADELAEVVEGMDLVFHLAAAQHEANVPNSHFEAVNVEGTRNVLTVACERGGRCRSRQHDRVYRADPSESVERTRRSSRTTSTGHEARRGAGDRGVQLPDSTVVVRISEDLRPRRPPPAEAVQAADKGLLLQVGAGIISTT